MSSALRPIQNAVLDCYAAAVQLVPAGHRHACILIGGAGSIAHGMTDRMTEDADIVVSAEALDFIWEAAAQQRDGWKVDADESVQW
jgi:hypothetical protein